MRPASESATRGSVMKSADPVSRNRAGARVGIHGSLDREDEPRRALDLVDNRPVEAANEADGIGGCGVECGGVVERDERDILACDQLRQRGLAGLPGAA